jgi:hypothetical protein
MFEKTLDGKNLNAILEEFGTRIYKYVVLKMSLTLCSVLMKHYQKYKVTQGTGGLKFLRYFQFKYDFLKLQRFNGI